MITKNVAGTSERTARRSRAEKLTIGVLIFLGMTAVGGGLEMLLFQDGNQYLPSDMLEPLPVDSFLLPGLVLLLVFGLGSLLVAWGMLTRKEPGLTRGIQERSDLHWSWFGTVAIGIGFSVWMLVEISLLGLPWEQTSSDGEASAWVLYGIYFTVAILLLTLPHVASLKKSLRR